MGSDGSDEPRRSGAAAVFASYIDAARAADEEDGRKQMWSLLSRHVQDDYVGGLSRWHADDGRRAQINLSEFRGETVKAFELNDRWAVGPVSAGQRVYAAPLVRMGEAWRVSPFSGFALLEGTVVGGAVRVTYTGTEKLDDAGVWIDDEALETCFEGYVRGIIDGTLEPGRHVVAAVGARGRDASAVAWTFRSD